MEFVNPIDALAYLRMHVNFTNRIVFLDIDDTLLAYKEGSIGLVAHMHRFYQFLISENAKIYIITARPHSERNLNLTIEQLNAFGYREFEGLFLMKLAADTRATAYNIALFKSTIRQVVRDSIGLDSVLSVGNELHDLVLPNYLGIRVDPLKSYLFNGVEENIHFLLKLPTIAI